MDPGRLTQIAARLARHRLSRRAALGTGGAGLAAALLGPVGAARVGSAAQEATPTVALEPGANLPPNVPAWMKEPGAPSSELSERSPHEQDVLRVAPSPAASFAPLQDLHGILTPNALFFEILHAGIPAIDPAAHRLLVHGQVDRPTLFTMDDLKRFPSLSVIHFLECSGNSNREWQEATIGPTVQLSHGLLGGAEWTGVPVATILREVGVKPGGSWLLAEGADAAAMTRSIPTEKAMRDGLLAYAANGEALRPSQGYPLRLLLPGYEGNMNIKWLRRLEVGDAPWHTREETSRYSDLMADGTARQFTFVMEAKSVITFPSGGQRIPGPGFWEITGLAWSGQGRIARVDVSTDGGATWVEARLQEPVLPISLTRFRFPWTWDGQPTRLQSRAVDETGYVQPTLAQLVEARGVNSFYHFNAIKTWAVAADGEVTNVYA
jgi:sulfane dehydrogenase subunit SoxC